MNIHAAYLAGIIDGEGSIMLPHTGTRKLNDMYTSFSVKVAISNTNIELLTTLQHRHGGKIERASTPKRVDHANFKDGFRLRWFGSEAIEVINLVRPHLIIKKRQADIAISVFERQRLRVRAVGAATSLDTVIFYNQSAAEIKALNKRGRL